MDFGVLLDGALGAFVGAVITGGTQVWSFRQGNKTARADLSLGAARDLLEDVHFSISILRQLPYTDNAAGSPLSYGERFGNSQPMRQRLEHAQFSTVPLLTNREVARVFTRFTNYCKHVSGAYVDAADIHKAVDEVIRYGDFVRDCVSAHINDQPPPVEPRVDVPRYDE